MTKYIFTNIPAYGHVNPTLPVVQDLVARGEEVIYYLMEEFRVAIEATEILRLSVERLIDESSFRTRVSEMQRHVQNAGGYKKAADAIIAFASSPLN